jgi:flagellar protein FlaF
VNVSQQARQAYSPNQSQVSTPRSLEAQLVSQVTAQLRNADKTDSDFPSLVAALHNNRRLWTTLATSVADTDNKLPKELRAQIFYLAEFTDIHTQKVLRKSATAAPLIDINMAILRGLNGKETI